jgi:hypothetical protein
MKIIDFKKSSEKQKVSKYNLVDRPNDVAPLAGTSMLQGAKELFLEREYYKDVMFKKFQGQDSNLVDSWNTMRKFGSTDPRGVPCVPTVEYMQEIRNADGGSVFVLNFVADAFDEMADDLADKANWSSPSEYTSYGSFYANPVAVDGWRSADDMYNTHMVGEMFDFFANDFVNRRSNRFDNFKQFVPVFMKFMKMAARIMPVTFSSFIKSKHCPPNTSGLVIDLSAEDPNDDRNKFMRFLDDPNFELFRKVAEKNGFLVDKHIPWRLYANLNHRNMMRLINKNGFPVVGTRAVINLYQIAFYQAYFDDIEYLRFYMAAYYNAIVKSEPVVFRPRQACNAAKKSIITSQIERDSLRCFNQNGALLEDSEYAKKYGPLFWMKVYYCLRNLEEGMDMDNKMLDKEIKKYYNLYKLQNLDKCVYAMNEKINAHSLNKSKTIRHKLMEQEQKVKKKKTMALQVAAAPPIQGAGSATSAVTPTATSPAPMTGGGGGGGY